MVVIEFHYNTVVSEDLSRPTTRKQQRVQENNLQLKTEEKTIEDSSSTQQQSSSSTKISIRTTISGKDSVKNSKFSKKTSTKNSKDIYSGASTSSCSAPV